MVSIHWTDQNNLLFRQIKDDGYLFNTLNLSNNTITAIGPRDGVSYRPVIDKRTKTAYFIHIGKRKPPQLIKLDIAQSNHTALQAFYESPYPQDIHASEFKLSVEGYSLPGLFISSKKFSPQCAYHHLVAWR